jgi:hypothetical protein
MINISEAFEHFKGKGEQILPSIGEKFAFLKSREKENLKFTHRRKN